MLNNWKWIFKAGVIMMSHASKYANYKMENSLFLWKS